MKANDFRLGNLYHFEDVSGMVVERVDYIENEMVDWNHLDLIHPIPLTEEWLLRFGFTITKKTKEGNEIWTFMGDEHKFEIEQIIGFYLYDNMCFGTEIKHVHQLQNLYFALCGEELILKEQ